MLAKRASNLALVLGTFLFLLPQITCGQMMQQGQLSLHAGASFPQGEFGSTDQDEENSGFATLGLIVVGEYTYPVGTPGLELVGTISLMANGVNEDELLEDAEEDVDISSGYWINVPIMGGLRYETEASPTTDVYGVGQVGINVNRGPTAEASNDNRSVTSSFNNPATSFGFTIGVGAVFNNQINASLRYQQLGKPELTTETELKIDGETVNEDENEYDQPLAAIQLLVGINL